MSDVVMLSGGQEDGLLPLRWSRDCAAIDAARQYASVLGSAAVRVCRESPLVGS
jgi:hypothetical protein